ncbi:MAG: AlpA family phage regulatory protein [Gammaproteobacteria bacterium]|nr:AlpA family phage regulatory protein [Gammaproteobacteria bacterium]
MGQKLPPSPIPYRSTIYQRIADGAFPKPISLGSRAVGCIVSEIDQWFAGRIAGSRNQTTTARFAVNSTVGGEVDVIKKLVVCPVRKPIWQAFLRTYPFDRLRVNGCRSSMRHG